MEFSITGKHMKLGSSLEEYVEERINNSVKKLLCDIIRADVVFEKEHSFFKTTISLHEAHGIGLIRSQEKSDDAYHSFDGALSKLEKQLRKHKDRIKNHHSKRKLAEVGSDVELQALASIDAKKYIFDSFADHEEKEGEFHPIIIEESSYKIETLTVLEAVMKMDLTHVSSLLFINKMNNRVNMVYYRPDGHIAWVDPGV